MPNPDVLSMYQYCELCKNIYVGYITMCTNNNVVQYITMYSDNSVLINIDHVGRCNNTDYCVQYSVNTHICSVYSTL